jgi:hypothetical protein
MVDEIPYEMGTCFLTTQYKEVLKLVEEYSSLDMIKPPNGTKGDKNVFTKEGQTVPYKLGHLVVGNLKKDDLPECLRSLLGDKYNMRGVVNAITNYMIAHKKIFGDYKYGLPPRPTEETSRLLNMTYMQFLKENNCIALTPLVRLVMTGQGYGLDTVPALYGLWWITPALLEDSIREKAGGPTVVNVLQSGFQNLWKTIADREELNVLYEVQIEKVNRHLNEPDQKITIEAKGPSGQDLHYECDFLIEACPLPFALKFMEDATDTEKELFSAIESYSVLTTLTEGPKYAPESEPNGITYHYQRLTPEDEGRMYAECNTHNVYLKPDGEKRWAIRYQMESKFVPEKSEQYRQQLWKDLELHGEDQTTTKVHDHNLWYYFPHFSQESINKLYPWKLLEAQGKNRTWYIGSSACFESVEDVVSYNVLLRDLFLPECN